MVRMVIEYVLAAVFVVLAVITVTTPQWIEALFGIDPDRGSGALEWLIVALFGLLAVVAAGLGTRDALARRKLQEG
jgi:hypothetical protein